MNRVPASKWDKLHGTILRTSAELLSGQEWLKTRSSRMSVGMLSPSSAAEVCGADDGRYNAVPVLPQGASDVQSIRAAQTTDPRAKQTRPLWPFTKVGQGKFTAWPTTADGSRSGTKLRPK